MDGPTLASELRRGVNAYNLSVAALSSAVIGGATAFVLPPPHALALALGLFCASTLLHTAMHATFGWQFERGIRASREGRHQQAVSMLAIVERRGMDHYDEHGVARRHLEASRTALSGAR